MKTLDDTKGADYMVFSANDIDPDYRLRLESSAIAQARRLYRSGGTITLVIEYGATQPITLSGYPGLNGKPPIPLAGAGVTNGQRVLTGSGEIAVVLGGGFWTVQP